jgi:hypothetical protein
MPALTPKLMYIGNDSTANAYSVANVANNYSIIKSINICNATANSASASIHILVAGASPAANNKIISNAEVLGNNVLYYNTSIVIPSNSNVYIAQSSTDLTFTISGVEYA